MTIQYLVTGRQGFTDSHLCSYGEAITKTYGDIFGDLKEDALSNAIQARYHKDLVHDYSCDAAEDDWTDLDYLEHYDEEGGWNQVDCIFEFTETASKPKQVFTMTWCSDQKTFNRKHGRHMCRMSP